MIKAEGRNPVYEALKAHRVLKLKIAREVEKEKKDTANYRLVKSLLPKSISQTRLNLKASLKRVTTKE